MSVITSLPATPNRMKIVWTYLSNLCAGSIKVEELQRRLGPASLRVGQAQDEEAGSGSTIGDDVIIEMRNLGLVNRASDGTISLASSALQRNEEAFLSCLERRLLDPVEAERYRQSSFPLALAWFLAQDPVFPMQWGHNYSMQVRDDCGVDVGSFELTNVARWQQFVYYLGTLLGLRLAHSGQ